MDTLISKTASNLAQNIIFLRKKKKLTQEKLASLAGVTRASIALIESGISNPSLEILMKLSQSFQVSIDELLVSPQVECKHIKSNEIKLDRRSKNGIHLKKLLPDKIRATEIDQLELEPGTIFQGSPHIEGTKEYFTCIEGQMNISIAGKNFTLEKGDVLAFPGDKVHAYKNLSRKKTCGISVVFFHPEPL